NQFAEATGDFQWIHVDTERARRELPGGKTIAHGYLTLSLIPALTGDFVRVENLARALNFGCNKVRFYTMVPVGSRVRARALVKQARQRAGALHLLSEVRIEVEGERKPACVAETLGMYFFDGKGTAGAGSEQGKERRMEVKGFFVVLVLIADVYAILQIMQSSASNIKKALWIVLVLLLPLAGFILWYLLGSKPS